MIASVSTRSEYLISKVTLVAPVPPPNGGMAMQAQKLRAKLRKEGLAVDLIPINPEFPIRLRWSQGIPGVRTIVRFWIYIFLLMQLRKGEVVHIFAASHLYFFLSVIPAICVGSVLNKRVILNYRGGEAESFFDRWGWLTRFFLRLCDEIVVPSEFLKAVFRCKFGIEPELLPNIADNEIFAFRRRSEFRPIYIATRQLEPIYGHHTLIRAFTRVRQVFPEARLKIAGDGSLRKELEEKVVRLNLGGVEFLGVLDHQALAKVYDSCDILVNTSEADNFPGALIEAFLCGLPVVSTDAGGIPFMVEHRVSGLLVKPGDDAGLAEAMMELVRDPSLGTSMAEQGFVYARKYHWAQIRHQVMALYGGHSHQQPFEKKDCHTSRLEKVTDQLKSKKH